MIKLKNIEIFPLEIPLKKEFVTSRARQETHKCVLIKVQDENGMEGIGEADPRPHITGETLESVCSIVKRHFAPLLIDRDIANMERLHLDLDQLTELNPTAKSAIEIAVYDLLSKDRGVPLYDFLGGKLNTDLHLNAWCGINNPENAINLFKKKIKRGFNHSAKIKVGTNNHDDYGIIKKVRETLPTEMDLIVDANQAWTLSDAERILRKLIDIEGAIVVEQPLHWQNLLGMARLNKTFPFDIMADESLMSLQNAFTLLTLESASMFNIKLLKCGGILTAKKISNVAEAAGVPCMVGSTLETGVSASALIHFALSTPNVRYLDISLPEDHLVEDIATGFISEGDNVVIPEKSGLGIEINEKAIERYKISSSHLNY